MNGLFWLVCGTGGAGYGDGNSNGGFGDGYGDGAGGDGLGNGTGYGGGGQDDGAGDGALMPALAVPRTLEAHAVVAAVLGRLP